MWNPEDLANRDLVSAERDINSIRLLSFVTEMDVLRMPVASLNVECDAAVFQVSDFGRCDVVRRGLQWSECFLLLSSFRSVTDGSTALYRGVNRGLSFTLLRLVPLLVMLR